MWFLDKKEQGIVLIDISSASVGGAFLYEKKGQVPALCYTTRHYVERRKGEAVEAATMRTLQSVCNALTAEGAACLYREIGSGHIAMVLASVSAPWQETAVRTISIKDDHSFVFTRALVQKALLATPPALDRIISDTSVISMTLNGYEVDQPWGRRADRADLTVLTSTLDRVVAKDIETVIRNTFHSHALEITAFAPVAYAVISNLYPHQEDFVLIDVAGSATNAIIVKQGVLAGVRSIEHGVQELLAIARDVDGIKLTKPGKHASPEHRAAEAEGVWLTAMKGLLADFASEHPLPRTVFLLADESARDYLKGLIDTSSLRTLWLSNDPLSVIPLAPEHTARNMRSRGQAEGDLYLSMLALFYQERIKVTKK